MNKFGKKLMIAGLCACMATATFAGCGPKADSAIATLDGTPVEYGVASFMVRYSQAQMQTMYGSYLGDDYWQSYGESSRDSMMDTLQEMLILEKHMDEYGVSVTDEEKGKITEAAKAFMESNDKDVINALAVDQATVERALTLYTIQTKMRAAIIKDVDTEVSDEEAAQKTIQYALFSTADTTNEDGTTTELSDDEKTAIKDQAQQVLDLVKGGDDLETALKAVDEERTPSTASYGADNGSIPDEVKEAADKLNDGEYSDELVEAEDGYYVIVMQSTFDEEATETQKQTIVSQRQSDKYDEVYEAWKEASEFVKDDKVVEKITFQDVYEIKMTEAETEAGTEAATEAGTEAGTETVTEAGTEAGTEAVTEADTEAETENGAGTEAQSETE